MTYASTWRKPTVYIATPKRVPISDGVVHVVGNPPMYWAELRRTGSRGHWRITWHVGTVQLGETFPTHLEALQQATRVIGEAVGMDWRSKLSGDQRTIIGQQLCPYPYGGGVHCQRSIEVGTIWCHRHPWGKGGRT
jgi:hypothetical protein